MTREQIIAKWETLTPRERDAWVAEVVFEVELPQECNRIGGCLKIAFGPSSGCLCDTPVWLRYPIRPYTTDINAAWTVVDVMADCLHLKEHGPDGEWSASFCGTGCDGASGETASLAICLAALIAKLVEGAAS